MSRWQLSDQATLFSAHREAHVTTPAKGHPSFAAREAAIGPSRKPPWPAGGSGCWVEPAAPFAKLDDAV
jgi:hypothetical protein